MLMQKRVLLDAVSISTKAQEVGVYVGIQQMEYSGMSAPYLPNIGPFSATGGPFSVAAGRLSFIYGFNGPSVSRIANKDICLSHLSLLHKYVSDVLINQCEI